MKISRPASIFISSFIIAAVLVACYLSMIRPLFHADETTTDLLQDMESRIRFVRLPGRPELCLAALPGHRGYGATILSGVRCADVESRIVTDEKILLDLGSGYGILRISGTTLCLAHAWRRSTFLVPCGPNE